MKRFLFSISIAFLFLPLAGLHAENYYLSPGGSNSASGTSPDQAWASLQYASSRGIGAGDTLFIMGGTYSDSQYFHRSNGSGGAPGNPLVFKAYGDDIAIFQLVGLGDRHLNYYFYFYYGSDYVTIDGFSYQNPGDSLFIKLEGHEDASYAVRFMGASDGSDWCEGITVRGIEIDGDHEWDAPGGLLRYGIGMIFGRDVLLESNYIHHIYHATGDLPGGDGTDRAQGTGEAIYFESMERSVIRRNTIRYINHAGIAVGQYLNPGYPVSRFVKIEDNLCEIYWGGGIYVFQNSEYCLVEGNVITHCGETTTKTKGAFYIAGSHNTIRKNVTYCPMSGTLGMKGMRFEDFCYIVESNLVYNNTFFGGQAEHLELVVKNTGANACADARLNDNFFANNIFYKSWGNTTDVGSRAGELKLYLYDASAEHNWLDPDAAGVSPASTHWGGNSFWNNCIRKDGHDANWGEAIVYAEDAEYGGIFTYSIPAIQVNDPLAWRANIGDVPMIASEFPDAYGPGWWRLNPGSPCVDRGTLVDDANGAYVESMHPGYGWGNLDYLGTAPDIGAHESDGENPAPLSAPLQRRIVPPTR